MEGEKTFSNFSRIIVGGFLGGVAGLLSAPKSGKELKIRHQRDWRENS